MKKIIALILIVALAGVVFAACGETAGPGGDTDVNAPRDPATPAGNGETEAPEEQIITHGVPLTTDFDGHEFRILNTLQADHLYMNMMMEPIDEEITGEIINDAAYRRSVEIQERFNAQITEVRVPSGSRDAQFRRSALAGDNAFDIASLSFGEAFRAAQEGLIYDINQLLYVDLDAPWWDQNARSSLSIQNRVFFLPGAYEISNFDMTRIIIFNRDLVEDYHLADCLYTLVLEGRWTMDRFFEMASQVSEDLNGDGIFDHRDKFGAGTTADHVVFGSFMMGSGEQMVRKDHDDIPYFAAGNERFINVFQYMVENFFAGDFFFNPRNVAGTEGWLQNMFSESRLLFWNITFNRIPGLRGMEADFGILPIPKFDEMQENYYNESGAGRVAVVPVSVFDAQRSGAFLELYSYWGWREVVPAYKELSLQTRFARSAESALMVDIIDQSRVYDLGRLFWAADAWDPFVTLFGARRPDVTSVLDRHSDRVGRAIEATMDRFEDTFH